MEQKIWIGHYNYRLEDEISENHNFEIHANLDDGSFSGVAIEEEFTQLTGDKPTVKGFIEDDMISFVKSYPYLFETDENGKQIIDKSIRGHQVEYEGYFEEDKGSWSGTWEIHFGEQKIDIGNYEFQFIMGEWSMKLKID